MKALWSVVAYLALQTLAFASPNSSFITRPGVYVLFDDRLDISITESHHRLRYNIGNRKIFAGLTEAQAFPADSAWFLYPESDTRVWAFQGVGPLYLYTVSPNRVEFTNSDISREILAQSPKLVLDRFESSPKKAQQSDAPK